MDKLRHVYEILYPYGFYNYKPGETCLVIERELKNLCQDGQRHLLLIVGRYLNLFFSPNTTTSTICQRIQNKIRDICLHYGDDLDKSEYIIGLKTGTVKFTEDESILDPQNRGMCRLLLKSFYLNFPIWDIFNHGSNFYYLNNIWHGDLPNGNNFNYQLLKSSNKYMIPSPYGTIGRHKVGSFEELWKDSFKQDYIFIPELMISGRPEEIRRYYGPNVEAYINNALTHNNYTTSKAEVYQQERSKEPKLILSKSILDMFKADMIGIDLDQQINRIIDRDDIDSDIKPFLYKLYDMIINEEIELAQIEDNKVKFLTIGDLC
jgi:hypothetical protein